MKITVRDDIILRSLTPDDAAEVFTAVDANRLYLHEWLPWLDATVSAEVIENIIEGWELGFITGGDAVFGIFDDGVYIGNIGLHDIKSGNNGGMIGYWLAESAQGRGIMTSCVRAVVDYCFNERGLNRVTINCAVPNRKSRAIPERLGFAQEGTTRDGELLYGVYYDQANYGMLKREWNELHKITSKGCGPK